MVRPKVVNMPDPHEYIEPTRSIKSQNRVNAPYNYNEDYDIPGLPHFDAFPFILLTLVLSLQAAYAAPIIMMSQNRQSDRDRIQAMEDFETNVKAKEEIEKLITSLDRIEVEKLDKILAILNKTQK
jgi:hypothetical protein